MNYSIQYETLLLVVVIMRIHSNLTKLLKDSNCNF